jgi:hypothetical protein
MGGIGLNQHAENSSSRGGHVRVAAHRCATIHFLQPDYSARIPWPRSRQLTGVEEQPFRACYALTSASA